MIKLKRYLKIDGQKFKPGDKVELIEELEAKYVNSGTAEYIKSATKLKAVRLSEKNDLDGASAEQIIQDESVIKEQVDAEGFDLTNEEAGMDEELETRDVDSTNDGADTEDIESNEIVPATEDVKINFDEDEYASGSNRRKRK